MKSITGRTQRNNYFVNGLSAALKKQEKDAKIQHQKAEQEPKKKKLSNFNADIEIYTNAEDSFGETPLNITKSPKKANK